MLKKSKCEGFSWLPDVVTLPDGVTLPDATHILDL